MASRRGWSRPVPVERGRGKVRAPRRPRGQRGHEPPVRGRGYAARLVARRAVERGRGYPRSGLMMCGVP
jgi:hypothetical protein